MKLVLKQAVQSLGQPGDVVNVADGYGRNFLLPRGLAVAATAGNLKAVEFEKKAYLKKEQKRIDEAKAYGDRILSKTYSIACKVGEEDKLFGSVTSADIAEAMAKEGLEVDKKKIVLESPLNVLGSYLIPVKLHSDVQVEAKVEVVKE